MSVHALPRVHFAGSMAWDPIVSNNDPSGTYYDGVSAAAVFSDGETVADFRRTMIEQTGARGNWNYYGSNSCALQDTVVTGGGLASANCQK